MKPSADQELEQLLEMKPGAREPGQLLEMKPSTRKALASLLEGEDVIALILGFEVAIARNREDRDFVARTYDTPANQRKVLADLSDLAANMARNVDAVADMWWRIMWRRIDGEEIDVAKHRGEFHDQLLQLALEAKVLCEVAVKDYKKGNMQGDPNAPRKADSVLRNRLIYGLATVYSQHTDNRPTVWYSDSAGESLFSKIVGLVLPDIGEVPPQNRQLKTIMSGWQSPE